MKMTKLIIIGALMMSSSLAFAKEANVKVKGMVCSFCAQGITKKFKAQPEVKDVKVNLDKHLVTLSFNDSKDLSDAKITDLLKEAGYSVDKVDRAPAKAE